jgi:hypothetical protein
MAAGTCAVIAAGFTLLALPREHLDLAPARASGVSLLGVGLAPVRGGATAGLALSF